MQLVLRRLLRSGSGLLAISAILAGANVRARRALPLVQPNPNTDRVGVLRDGVLTITLEAKPSLWHLNGPTRPPMTIEAFAQPGKSPLMPGPLVRAPAGTELRLAIRNSLSTPLTFLIPVTTHGGPDRYDAMDSIVVAPGATGALTTKLSVPGNYIYRATTRAGVTRFTHLTGILAGALVIDSAGAATPPVDRVFVIMGTPDSATRAFEDTVSLAKFRAIRDVFTVNGRSWPNTELVHASIGDSLHWRVISASWQPHPMHLHGFYYRVDDFSGPDTERFGRPFKGQMVVTALMSGFSTMSMTWSPNRSGNWLFHCHFAVHVRPDSLLSAPNDPHERMMVGLALGTMVSGRPGVVATGDPATTRHLRLIAEIDHGERITPFAFERAARTVDSVPNMHFVLEENDRRVDPRTDLSPELDLVRGEPVSITIVNHLPEPTAVHWHGIEVEDSYMDGVPDFSGDGQHVTPAIAPGDSFVARFAPPRAGTFMYHAHIDEIREQLAGLEGALVVRDPGVARSADDHTFFFKEEGPARQRPQAEINGQTNPDTVVLRVGQPGRLRLLSLSSNTFAPMFLLTRRRDSVGAFPTENMLERWQPAAKDGFDVSATHRLVPARQVISMGETYDFAYTPQATGSFRLEVWRIQSPELQFPPRLLITVPIRVE